MKSKLKVQRLAPQPKCEGTGVSIQGNHLMSDDLSTIDKGSELKKVGSRIKLSALITLAGASPVQGRPNQN